jgi:F-type H+-transporting ATPase subunit epsilon
MILRLSVPTAQLLEVPVTQVVAEGPSGSFCLLPKHLDVVAVLIPSLLTFRREGAPSGSPEGVAAVDHGLLTKVGDRVTVICQRALVAEDAAGAVAALRARAEEEGEREKRARLVLARLEADVVRQLGSLRGRDGS